MRSSVFLLSPTAGTNSHSPKPDDTSDEKLTVRDFQCCQPGDGFTMHQALRRMTKSSRGTAFYGLFLAFILHWFCQRLFVLWDEDGAVSVSPLGAIP